MKNRNLKILSLLYALCLLLPAAAAAVTPYRTFTVNGYGEIQETQTAYTVRRIITRFDNGGRNDVVLSEVKKDLRGLFVGADGRIYLTYGPRRGGNVYVADADGRLVGEIESSVMANPSDVFVRIDDDGAEHVYVADPEARIEGAADEAVQNISLRAEEPEAAPEAEAEPEPEPAGPKTSVGQPSLVYDPKTDTISLIVTVTVAYPADGETEASEEQTETELIFERAGVPEPEETGEETPAETEPAAPRSGDFDPAVLEAVWAVKNGETFTDTTLTIRGDCYELSLPQLAGGYASAGTWTARSTTKVQVGAVFEFVRTDGDYALAHIFTKPESPLYGANTTFRPLRVVVNHAGILYIICDGNANGIVEIAPGQNGEPDTFLGYFGTNYATVGAWDIFLRSIRTAEQRAMSGNSTNPRSPTNLDLDDRGLIYTVTQGDGSRTLKRLNIAGSNLIPEAMVIDKPAGIAAGLNDNVYVADEDGFIYEFNAEGELIFVFGGKDDGTSRAGLFKKITAVDVGPDGCLYVLDSTQKTITVFEPTEFTVALHDALALYAGGRYTESKEPLDQVLDMNSMFDVANRAMGRAYFQEENYGDALRYARLAKDKDGYSDAYWEVRNVWLKRNIATVFIVIIALAVIWKVVKMLDRRHGFLKKLKPKGGPLSRSKTLSDLRYSFFYMKHPIDGSYGIAREGRASWTASLILLFLFAAEFLINKYFCGFLQKTVQDGRYEIFSDVGILLAAVAGLVGCNYLVCTINEGEGTVKKIFTYFCYSLTPYILLTPVIFLLSQVLTKNEQFLITLLQILAYAWVAVLLVIGIREVNNYNGKQTLKIILLTLFTVLILALIIFILYILWAQVFKFIGEIFGEVVYRVG